MNVLVTGATGFLGGAVARRLAAAGNAVRALGRNEAAGRSLASRGIHFIRADLADAPAVREACRGQDCVVHCGALSAPWGRYADFYRSNVIGTENVAAGCSAQGVRRLVHVSTPSVYMKYADRLQIREDEALPKVFVNDYAKTKRMAELIVEKVQQAGVPAMILRPRALFGPGDRTLFPRIIRANAAGGIPCFGRDPLVDVTYIDNAVEAICLCLRAPDTACGSVYNISNGDPRALLSLLRMLFEAIGEPLRLKRLPYWLAYGAAALAECRAAVLPGAGEPRLTRYGVGVLHYAQTLDITAARQRLQYTPVVSIETGLTRFAAAWRKAGR